MQDVATGTNCKLIEDDFDPDNRFDQSPIAPWRLFVKPSGRGQLHTEVQVPGEATEHTDHKRLALPEYRPFV